METALADQARPSQLLDFFGAGLRLSATGDIRTTSRTLQRASGNDIMSAIKIGPQGRDHETAVMRRAFNARICGNDYPIGLDRDACLRRCHAPNRSAVT